MTHLTPAQGKVLQAVQVLMDERGWSPSVREIAERIGLKATAVHWHLVNLRELGYIAYQGVRQIRVLVRVQ